MLSYPLPLGDALPGAPALAARGTAAAGVRTVTLVHEAQYDFAAGAPGPRPLVTEVWYPAKPSPGSGPAVYTDHMGRADLGNLTAYDFSGRALRDAEPDPAMGPRPVVLLSHGYPGSRMLLCNLAENLSSKGYVVLAVSHRDNAYTDFLPERSMESALYHRSRDQRFVLDCLPGLNTDGFLKGLLDLGRVALIGFSMGGYGVLRTLGAGLHPQAAAAHPDLPPEEAAGADPRVRAAVLFAPAAMLTDPATFGNITAPTLWVCGTADKTVGYDSVRAAWQSAVRSDRYLVSYTACGHNVANNPPPACALTADWTLLKRWADPVWDTWRLNNLNAHFVTAFLDAALSGSKDAQDFLDGSPLPGFVESTDAGVAVEHLTAGGNS